MGAWIKVPGKTVVTWEDESGKLRITSYEKFKKAKEEGKVKGVDALVTADGKVYDFRDGGLFGSDVVSPDKVEEVVSDNNEKQLAVKDVYRTHDKGGYTLVYVADKQFWKNREKLQREWEQQKSSKRNESQTTNKTRQISPIEMVMVGNEAIRAGRRHRQRMIERGKDVVERYDLVGKLSLSTYAILYDEFPLTNLTTSVDYLTGKISREEYYYRLGELSNRAIQRANEVKEGGIFKAAEHVYTKPNVAGAVTGGLAIGGAAGLGIRGLAAISPIMANVTGLALGAVGGAEVGLAVKTAVDEKDKDMAAIITAGLIGSMIGVSRAFPAKSKKMNVRNQDISIDEVVDAMENFKVERHSNHNNFIKLIDEGAIESPIPSQFSAGTDKITRLRSKSTDELLQLRSKLLDLADKGSKKAVRELEVVDKVLNEKVLNKLPKEKTSKPPRGVKYDEWVDKQLGREGYYSNPFVRTVEIEVTPRPRSVRNSFDNVRSPRDSVSESKAPKIDLYNRGWESVGWRKITVNAPVVVPVPIPVQKANIEGIEVPEEISGTQTKESQIESQKIVRIELPSYDTKTFTIPLTFGDPPPKKSTTRINYTSPPPQSFPKQPFENVIPIIPLPTIPVLGGSGGRGGTRYRTRYNERFNPIGTWEVLERLNLDALGELFGVKGSRKKGRRKR